MNESAVRTLARGGSMEEINRAAKDLYDKGDLEDTKALLELATERSDASPGTFANLGLVRLDLGDFLGAVAAYSRAVEQVPDVRVNRGLAYEKLGDLKAARADYEKALQDYPDDVDALVNLGTLLLAADESSEAYALLERAAELDPTAIWAFGDALLAVGRRDEARAAYEAALQGGELRAHLDLANLDDEEGHLADAKGHFEAAVAAGATGARSDFADFLTRNRRPDAAIRVSDGSGTSSG